MFLTLMSTFRVICIEILCLGDSAPLNPSFLGGFRRPHSSNRGSTPRPWILLDWNSNLLVLVRYWLMFLNHVRQVRFQKISYKKKIKKIRRFYFFICFRMFWVKKKLRRKNKNLYFLPQCWKNMKTKLRLTQKIFIGPKNDIDEKRLAIDFLHKTPYSKI